MDTALEISEISLGFIDRNLAKACVTVVLGTYIDDYL